MVRDESETLTRILAAATREFSAKGYHGTTARDIGNAAGLTKGHFYYYFDNKEDLLFQILLNTVQHQLAGLQEVVERKSTPDERLRKAIRFHTAFAAAHPELVTLVTHETRHLAPARRREVEATREEYVGLLANILRAGIATGHFPPVDVRFAALAILGMCHHAALRYKPPGQLRPADISEQLIGLLSVPLIRGVAAGANNSQTRELSGPVPPLAPGKEIPTMTLADLIRRNARLYPDKVAFCSDRRSVTFAEFHRRTNQLVNALLVRGLRKGDRVAIFANNSVEYLEVYGAAEKGGLILAPLNFRLTAGEVAALIQDVRPRVLFVQQRYLDRIAAVRDQLESVEVFVLLPEDEAMPPPGYELYETLVGTGAPTDPPVVVHPADTAYLIFTSGTTGLPRAAMLTHYGQWMDALAIATEMALTPQDSHLGMMPLYHVGGRALVLAHTLRGCTVMIQDGFDEDAVLGAIARHRLTTVQVVPTMVVWMLDHLQQHQYDLSSLRMVWYASAPMPVELLRRALKVFGPIFIQGYGQTESGPLATVLHPHEHVTEGPAARRLASCGRPCIGAEVRVLRTDGSEVEPGEVGEITVRSPYVMVGYWERPEATADVLREGWLYTGDMGTVDEDGYIYIVDRKKDMIISGGENIYPREIEEVLYMHPAVREAAVFGVPDDEWGESVMAQVVLREGAQVTADDLIAFSRARLAGYKRPKQIVFKESLPKSPSGKILKRELRQPYWQQRERQV